MGATCYKILLVDPQGRLLTRVWWTNRIEDLVRYFVSDPESSRLAVVDVVKYEKGQ